MNDHRRKRGFKVLPPDGSRRRWCPVIFFFLGLMALPVARSVWSVSDTAKESKRMPINSRVENARSPWGALEFTEVRLERPLASLPKATPVNGATFWFFEGFSADQLRGFFQRAALTDDQRNLLLDPLNWRSETNGWWVSPPLEVIKGLGGTARAQIYGVLSRSAKNVAPRYPLRVPHQEFPLWLAESGLSPENQERFRRMTYREGGYVCFADCAVMETDCTDQEKACLARALSQVPALVVKLRVGPDSDMDALVRYWGRAGRGEVMRPLLDSLRQLPDGGSVNVSFFFPDLMRSKLYTYPLSSPDSSAPGEDCFWTAMNFFNRQPDNRFFDGAISRTTLEAEYEPVQGEWLFGDLMVLVDPTQRAQHMCVYVAADVVFTKNGMDPLEPWVLMRIEDMLARYPSEIPQRIVGYRRRSS